MKIKNKLNTVLLIDDSDADNFIHSRIIRKANITDNIVTKYDGQEALEYLTTLVDDAYPKPELVFLDINMPGMNGWQFLDAYKKLPTEQKAGVIVCMLTTSVAEQDKNKAEKYNILQSYTHKPLTMKMLEDMIKQHFPERIEVEETGE